MSTPVSLLLARTRYSLAAVAAVSVAINLLSLAGAFYSVQVFDRVFTSGSHETLLVLTLLFAGLLVVQGLFEGIRNGMLNAIGRWLEAALGPVVLRAGLHQRGDGAAGLRDLLSLRSQLTGPGVLALIDLPWAPLYLGLLLLIHPWVGMLALGSGLLLLLITLGFDLWSRPRLKHAALETADALQLVGAAGRACEAIASMGLATPVIRAWAEQNSAASQRSHGVARVGGNVQALAKVVRLGTQIAGIALCALLVLDQQLSAGLIIGVTILLSRALAPIEQITGAWRSLIDLREGLARLRQIPAESARHSLSLPRMEGRLVFDAVTLVQPGRLRPILEGVSFSLEPGQCLGVIGPSGSGKSTVARLALGLVAPSRGSVRLDGLSAHLFDHDRFGDQIGYLPQDVQLLPGTVADNIARFSQGDANRIVEAAKAAGVHELILKLSAGYDTKLQEGGAPLSGGQRQRIGLARALYGAPRLIVLDEPDAALDPTGEQDLVQTLALLRSQGVSVMLIGHRMAAFRSTDLLLVLRDGHVERFGPRSDVLRSLSPQGTRPGGPQSAVDGSPTSLPATA